MKYSKLFAVVGIIMVLSINAVGKSVEPTKTGAKCRLVGGSRDWIYYQVTNKNPTTWVVEGPGHVKIYARVPGDRKGEFTLYIDGEEYKVFEIEKKKSLKYKMQVGDGKPTEVSTAEKARIKIGSGEHTIKLVSKEKLFVRLLNEPKKSTSKAPEKYSRALSLITGDTKTTYYTATREKPAVLEYEGSGTLTVWTRLAFDKNMKGTQHYTLVTSEVGGKTRRMKLETVISETSVWENDGGVIPGKARKFTVVLSKGSHTIKFWPEDTPAPYCALRFTLSK